METIAPSLVDHGIQTEDSDIRCHVAPGTQNIFVFQTAAAQAFIAKCIASRDDDRSALSFLLPIRHAGQRGVRGVTAQGYAVPWDLIPGIRRLEWRTIDWWTWFSPDQSPSEKGHHAVSVVQHLLQDGRFPLWCHPPSESTHPATQIAGTDLDVRGRWRIQVKCDYNAGPGGTGNVFLQVAECNPLHHV